MDNRIDQLSDRAVIAALGQTVADIAEQGPVEMAAIGSEAEARAAIASFLQQQGVREIAPGQVIAEESATPQLARTMLALLMKNEETHGAALEAALNPPADSQKSIEIATAGAVILASLITWLQTSVEISLSRKDGKLEFHFSLKKAATEKKTLADVAATVSGLIT